MDREHPPEAQDPGRLAAENQRLRMQFELSANQVNELNDFIQIMLNLSPFGICIIQGRRLLFTNRVLSDTLGFSPKQLRNRMVLDIVFEADRRLVLKSALKMLRKRSESFFMFRVTTHSEKIKWVLGAVAFIRMNGKRAMLGTFVDLTEGSLMQLAYNDALTGLPNRRLMMDRLEQAIVTGKRRNQSLALLFIDLDAFKNINDRHGHEVGDKLLIELAGGFREVVRRENDTISRIGGDEFLILITNTVQREHIEIIIRNLFEKFAAPLAIPGTDLKIPVTFSIGIAIFPDHGEDGDTLIRHADQAMYQVKKTPGKNSYHYFKR